MLLIVVIRLICNTYSIEVIQIESYLLLSIHIRCDLEGCNHCFVSNGRRKNYKKFEGECQNFYSTNEILFEYYEKETNVTTEEEELIAT